MRTTTDLAKYLHFATGKAEALAEKVTCPKGPHRSKMRCQSAKFQVMLLPTSNPVCRSFFSSSGSSLSESEAHLPGDSILLGLGLAYLEAFRKYLRLQAPTALSGRSPPAITKHTCLQPASVSALIPILGGTDHKLECRGQGSEQGP